MAGLGERADFNERLDSRRRIDNINASRGILDPGIVKHKRRWKSFHKVASPLDCDPFVFVTEDIATFLAKLLAYPQCAEIELVTDFCAMIIAHGETPGPASSNRPDFVVKSLIADWGPCLRAFPSMVRDEQISQDLSTYFHGQVE